MAVKASSLSCLASSLSSPYQTRRRFQPRLSGRLYDSQRHDSWQLKYAKVESCNFVNGIFKFNGKFSKRKSLKFSNSHGQSQSIDQSVASEQDDYQPNGEDVSPSSNLYLQFRPTGGKPGLISFYNHPYKDGNKVRISSRPENHQNSVLWFMGPAILVASFVFPSLYLRRILSIIFEDSLLTDFLILFFTEALFYCGVGVFLLLIDILRRPTEPDSSSDSSYGPQALGQRISSVAVLVLSLIIPMVTMGFVWPWTGPAASATLAPYLVGIVVQFAFEQYARRKKSPSWPVIPIIFQVYRLHQLNRAAQLVTALTFTVRGVEMTPHNISINSSLGTLHNVLHCLGVICIWSLSSFLMRFFPIA